VSKLNLSGEDLAIKVDDLFDTLAAVDLPFNRGVVSSALKKRGYSYDSGELSAIVKEVATNHGLVSTRYSFKEGVIAAIGEEIFNEKDLIGYLIAKGKEPTPTEIKKYIRYVNLAERLVEKYKSEDNAA